MLCDKYSGTIKNGLSRSGIPQHAPKLPRKIAYESRLGLNTLFLPFNIHGIFNTASPSTPVPLGHDDYHAGGHGRAKKPRGYMRERALVLQVEGSYDAVVEAARKAHSASAKQIERPGTGGDSGISDQLRLLVPLEAPRKAP
jgi:hypothetical protein